MRKQLTITYHWTCNELEEIPNKHLEALEEDAEKQIFRQLSEGNTSGELSTLVRFGQEVVKEETPENGLSYRGWFNISKTNI